MLQNPNSRKVKPIAFNDGVCSVWTVEKNHLKDKLGVFDFHEETIGIRAFYELGLQGKQIDRVISIPYQNLIDYSTIIQIEDKRYTVTLIQKKETFPVSLRLTLEKSPIRVGDKE